MKKFRHSLDGMTEQLMSSVKLLLKNIVEKNAEIRTVLVDIPKMMK